MLPYLHQSNDDAKRKLRVRRDQKCNRLFGAKKNVLAVAGFQIISIDAKPNSADNGNLGKLGFLSMVPYLHQSNDYIKRKLRVWRP